MALKLDGSLWRFALSFYARPGVAEACLALQEAGGIDVIQLIALAYADAILDAPLSAGDMATLRRESAPWRDATVLPLRALRRFLKPPREGFPEEKEQLRDKVKAAELMAEQIQLAMIEEWLLLRGKPAGGLPLVEAFAALLDLSGSGRGRDDAVTGPAFSVLARELEALRQSPDQRPQG